MAAPGIFCIEGEWDRHLRRRRSVEPQLNMLRDAEVCGPVIHRDVATRTDFNYYLNTWLQRGYGRYTVGYLAFHGSRNTLYLADDTGITLDSLQEQMASKASGKILYLGSCRVLAGKESRLREFCQTTGAKALVGYTRNVDWLEAASFDFLLLPELLRGGFANTIHRRLTSHYADLVSTLGLTIATKTAVHSPGT